MSTFFYSAVIPKFMYYCSINSIPFPVVTVYKFSSPRFYCFYSHFTYFSLTFFSPLLVLCLSLCPTNCSANRLLYKSLPFLFFYSIYLLFFLLVSLSLWLCFNWHPFSLSFSIWRQFVFVFTFFYGTTQAGFFFDRFRFFPVFHLIQLLLFLGAVSRVFDSLSFLSTWTFCFSV